jgi:hypothetical protein
MTHPLLAESIAYHEAGHVVVAAVLKRPLNSSGIHVDCVDRGVSFYDYRKPDGDYFGPHAGTKEEAIIALRAGKIAQRKFYPECPVGILENCAALDEDTIQRLLRPEPGDSPELSSASDTDSLRLRAETLVNDYWPVIKEVGRALWATPRSERNKALEPRTDWSESNTEKTLDGRRLQEILEGFDLKTVIWDPPTLSRIRD